MRRVTGPWALLVFLVGGVGGLEPRRGSCIGTQCFTAFLDPADFAAAQTQCAQRSGHLMTVRSTVARDVLSVLLTGLSGRFWIGLHRPVGCPDSAELRGFEWVTNDSATDWLDWAPGFDSGCSSPRCVSVSEDTGFQWVQDACEARAPGFLCEHGFQKACGRLAAAHGDRVTYTTPFGFGGEDVASLPPGTVAVRMPAGTRSVCFSEQWMEAPWTCEIHEGGCEHKCTQEPFHGPVCSCPPGHSLNPDNQVTCQADSDDPCLALRCQHACYEDAQSHACTCDQGYTLARDGRSCVDFDECADERQCPGDHVRCVNLPGGFECTCQDGYREQGHGQCVDMNECAWAPCEHECWNTPGSYLCTCYPGYKVDPASPQKCKLFCGAETCLAECDPNDPTMCYCPDGYVAEERPTHAVCIDIDECDSNFCDQGCENTFGSYVCSCFAGHVMVRDRCVKEEEDGAWEGSGATTALPLPPFFTSTVGPTRRPSAVSAGGLVGIIVCTVVLTLAAVFLIHHVLSSRGKMQSAGALKGTRGETHALQQVATDTC